MIKFDPSLVHHGNTALVRVAAGRKLAVQRKWRHPAHAVHVHTGGHEQVHRKLFYQRE